MLLLAGGRTVCRAGLNAPPSSAASQSENKFLLTGVTVTTRAGDRLAATPHHFIESNLLFATRITVSI